MQIIRRNFALKVFAITLAVIGWAYFRFATNPVIAAHFDQQLSVPIAAVNLPDGYIAHFTEKEAVVTIATSRGEPPIKPDEIKAVLDLSGKERGVYNVPVQLVAPNLVVQSLSPASVSLSVEEIENRIMPLSIHYSNQEQSGIVVGGAQLTPSNITVHGPEGALDGIATVRVEVPVPAAPQAFDEMLRPVAVDSYGAEVPGASVTPDLIRVKVQFIAGTGETAK